MTSFVHVFIAVLEIYLFAGILFAVPFVVFGVARVDAAARVASWGFHVVIAPGVVALWPWLAWHWASGRTASERNAHRDLARAERGKAGR